MWSALLSILGTIISALAPALLSAVQKPDVERTVAQTDPDRFGRLKRAKDSFGGVTLTLAAILLVGCTAERAYFVPPSVPVRLGEDISGVDVYVKDADTGEMVKATADLIAGMWILVDPDEWTVQDRAEAINLRPSD